MVDHYGGGNKSDAINDNIAFFFKFDVVTSLKKSIKKKEEKYKNSYQNTFFFN